MLQGAATRDSGSGQPEKDAQDKLSEYVKEQLPGLAARDLQTLAGSMEKLDIKLRQVNVNPSGASINNLGGTGLVDRCQSCHLGTDPLIVPVTMTVTKADLGLGKSKDAPQRKFIVDQVQVRNAKVSYGGAVSVDLGNVQLRDLGKKKGGATAAELTDEVWTELSRTALSRAPAAVEELRDKAKGAADKLRGLVK